MQTTQKKGNTWNEGNLKISKYIKFKTDTQKLDKLYNNVVK